MIYGLEFRFWGLGFRGVWGLGLNREIYGLGIKSG